MLSSAEQCLAVLNNSEQCWTMLSSTEQCWGMLSNAEQKWTLSSKIVHSASDSATLPAWARCNFGHSVSNSHTHAPSPTTLGYSVNSFLFLSATLSQPLTYCKLYCFAIVQKCMYIWNISNMKSIVHVFYAQQLTCVVLEIIISKSRSVSKGTSKNYVDQFYVFWPPTYLQLTFYLK